MKFTYNGIRYSIEFERTRGRVQVYDHIMRSVKHSVIAKHPFTEVFIRECNDKDPEFWPTRFHAKVGCYKKDHFSPEEGRKAALRKLMPQLSKEMRGLVWDTYLRRAVVKVPSSDVTPTTPAMTDEVVDKTIAGYFPIPAPKDNLILFPSHPVYGTIH